MTDVNIFEYSSYRDFLKDYYDTAKEKNRAFSHRIFAKKAGLTSPNYLHLVISGKRNLSRNFIPQFSTALGLSKREQNYFEALVSLNHATTPEAKRYYMELLAKFRKDKVGVLITDAQFAFLSNWYYPVIREMVTIPGFQEDYEWIRERMNFKVGVRSIKKAIATLLQLGLLVRNEEGRLAQADASLTTEDDVANTAAFTFHEQMLTLACDILKSTNGHEREISALTMTLSQRHFDHIRARIREFEDEIARYLANNPETGDIVYQMNLQFIPLTNKGQEGGSK